MDSRIVKLIKEHHVLTLATSKDNTPWTAHCFYAFLEEENALVFTTDDSTRHAGEMLDNKVVSGGIVLETKMVGKIRGAQLTGKVAKIKENKKFKNAYLFRFPYAALMRTSLWVLELETIKFTDNRLGFGTKLHWQRAYPQVKTWGK